MKKDAAAAMARVLGCRLLVSVRSCSPPRLAPAPPAGGLAPPLFLHIPPSTASGDLRLSEGTFEREWEQRVAAIFRSQVRDSFPFGLVQFPRCAAARPLPCL